MNISFANKLSHDAWHNTMQSSEENRKVLADWVLRYIMGAWSRSDPLEDIQVRPGSAKDPRPCSHNQTGTVATLEIGVNPNDCYLTDNEIGYGMSGPGAEVYPGRWCAREFSWSVVVREVDEWGYAYSDRCTDPEPRLVIHGGLINHGTHEKPRWRSHT